MLINQARNLANLPYSSLQQLEQSIQRTQQLLTQAQRIAYDVQQIDRAFSTTYAPASSSQSDQALIANAQVRWQNAVAGLQDAMRVQATVVGNLDTNRTQMSALVTASQGATGALQASQAGNQLLALQAQQLADLTAAVAAQGRAQNLEVCSTNRRSGSGQGTASALSDPRPRLSIHNSADVPLMPEQDKLFRRFPLIAAIGLVVLSVAACAVQLRPDQDSQPSAVSVGRQPSSCAEARELPAPSRRTRRPPSNTAGGSGLKIGAASSVRRRSHLYPALSSRRMVNPRPSRVQRIKAGCRRAIPPSPYLDRSRRWQVPASLTSFWKPLPATSIPASDCLAAKSAMWRRHSLRSTSRSRPCSGHGGRTRTLSPASSRRPCSSASSPISSATGTASPGSFSRALRGLA